MGVEGGCHQTGIAPSEKSESGSRLRKEAANFVKRYRNQVQPLVEQSWVDKAPLSEKNIDFFRNRSSHTSPVDALDAYVGRVIAGRALNLLFRPVLAEWGFRYTHISNARPPFPPPAAFLRRQATPACRTKAPPWDGVAP